MSEPLLTVWLPFPLADAGPILEAAIQDQLGRRVEVADSQASPFAERRYRPFFERFGESIAQDCAGTDRTYEPDTEHSWGIRLCMCLPGLVWDWAKHIESVASSLLAGRLFARQDQIVQRSVQVLSVNCPPENAGIRLECWHVPAPHDEGAEG